jgi:hypothetical protein
MAVAQLPPPKTANFGFSDIGRVSYFKSKQFLYFPKHLTVA